MIKILGVKINLYKREEVLEEVRKYLQKFKVQSSKFKLKEINPFIIFTPNPEIINYAQKDEYFKQIVNSAQINIPDGAGICLAIEKKFHLKTQRLTGTDLMRDICSLLSKNSFTIGLIGGKGSVALATRECLLREYPSLKIEVLDAPDFKVASSKYKVASSKYKVVSIKKNIPNTKYIILNTEGKQDEKTERYFQALVKEIINRRIDILFVALGFPKQEYFISQLSVVSCQLSVRPLVMMGVGGAFDYISGRVKRAPLWMRQNGLEWMFRLAQEPKRIIRMLKGSVFFYRILLLPPHIYKL